LAVSDRGDARAARIRRAATLAISLPSVVGLAGWPWVRRQHRQLGVLVGQFARRAMILSSAGSRLASRPSRSISAWETLLMSSEVQPKWMNSVTRMTSALSARRSLSQYSMAFTSWLVRCSMALMASPSATEKSAITPSSSAWWPAEKAAISASSGSAARALSHSISTLTRLRIRPNSEKCARKRFDLVGIAAVEGRQSGQGVRVMR
jgi:hypothetical protein